MKKLAALVSMVALLTITSCGTKNKKGDIDMDDEKVVELLQDNHFETGFDLMTTSTDNGRALSGVIDYNGEAKKTASRPWKMAQWWTPFDFKDATYSKVDNKHQYQNVNRFLSVDTKKGELIMGLDSHKEYMEKLGHSRTGSENWSHFLIEQDFDNAPKISELKHIYVDLGFAIDKCENKDLGQPIPCAQVSWYFTVTDARNGNTAYQSGDNSNDFFWFGLPLFDSRYDFLTPYKHVDSGFVGATNKLIYSLGSNTYLEEKIKIGKDYRVQLDILPYIKEAYLYGIANGAMSNTSANSLVLNYMNLGWELPGSFDVSFRINNMSVKIERK